MSNFNQSTNLPCPPAFSDYEVLTVDTSFNTVVDATLGKFQRGAQGIQGYAIGMLFKYPFVAGKKYFFGWEGAFTQSGFTGNTNSLYYWKPSDWGGSLLYPYTHYMGYTEDVGPFSCPFPYKLSEFPFSFWRGGNRILEITAEETGDYVFFIGFRIYR